MRALKRLMGRKLRALKSEDGVLPSLYRENKP